MRSGKRKIYSKQTYGIAHIIKHAMLQVSMKRGLKKWEKREEDTVSKYFKQFHTRETFLPLEPS